MNRTEELTLEMLERPLLHDEAEELETLLGQDGTNLRVHLRVLQIEANLRAERVLPDMSARVIAKIAGTATREKATGDVPEPPAVPLRHPGPRRRFSRMTMALAVLLLFTGVAAAFWLSRRPGPQPGSEGAPHDEPTGDVASARQGHAQAPRAFSTSQPTAPAPEIESAASEPLVFLETFEGGPDGLSPRAGVIVEGPPGASGQFVAQGSISEWVGNPLVTLSFRNYGQNLRWSDEGHIEFDYWVKGSASVWVQIWNAALQRNFQHWIGHANQETWTHVSVKMRDLVPARPSPQPPQNGDELQNVAVSSETLSTLFVDDIKITIPVQTEGSPR